jgi:hypothetical protein
MCLSYHSGAEEEQQKKPQCSSAGLQAPAVTSLQLFYSHFTVLLRRLYDTCGVPWYLPRSMPVWCCRLVERGAARGCL